MNQYRPDSYTNSYLNKKSTTKERVKKALVTTGVIGGGLLGAYGARKLFKSFLGDIPPLTKQQFDIEQTTKFPRVAEDSANPDRYIELGWKEQKIPRLSKAELEEIKRNRTLGINPEPIEIPKVPVDITSSRPFRKTVLGASMLGGGITGGMMGGLVTDAAYDYYSDLSAPSYSHQHAYFGMVKNVFYPNDVTALTSLAGGALGGLYGIKKGIDENDQRYWTEVAEIEDLEDEAAKKRLMKRLKNQRGKQAGTIISKAVKGSLYGGLMGNLAGRSVNYVNNIDKQRLISHNNNNFIPNLHKNV